MSVQNVKDLTRIQLSDIMSGMDRHDMKIFILERNVRIHGGINQYVDYILNKNIPSTLSKTRSSYKRQQLAKSFAKQIDRMLEYPGLTPDNVDRLLVLRDHVDPPKSNSGGSYKKTCKRRRSRKH